MDSKKTLLILTVLALGTISLISQTPPAPRDPATMAQHRVRFLTTVLSLTSQQQQQAMAIFTNAASARSSSHETMKTAHDALRTAVKNNDSAGITQASATIGNLVAETTAAQAKADAAFNALLTPDQQTKFTQLEAGGHMRHGGPAMGFRP